MAKFQFEMTPEYFECVRKAYSETVRAAGDDLQAQMFPVAHVMATYATRCKVLCGVSTDIILHDLRQLAEDMLKQAEEDDQYKNQE